MKLPKFKYKQLYRIKFIDHAIGDSTIECELCGWFLSQTKDSITLTWWKLHSEDEAHFEANLEPVSLVKSTILEIAPIP